MKYEDFYASGVVTYAERKNSEVVREITQNGHRK